MDRWIAVAPPWVVSRENRFCNSNIRLKTCCQGKSKVGMVSTLHSGADAAGCSTHAATTPWCSGDRLRWIWRAGWGTLALLLVSCIHWILYFYPVIQLQIAQPNHTQSNPKVSLLNKTNKGPTWRRMGLLIYSNRRRANRTLHFFFSRSADALWRYAMFLWIWSTRAIAHRVVVIGVLSDPTELV